MNEETKRVNIWKGEGLCSFSQEATEKIFVLGNVEAIRIVIVVWLLIEKGVNIRRYGRIEIGNKWRYLYDNK